MLERAKTLLIELRNSLYSDAPHFICKNKQSIYRRFALNGLKLLLQFNLAFIVNISYNIISNVPNTLYIPLSNRRQMWCLVLVNNNNLSLISYWS